MKSRPSLAADGGRAPASSAPFAWSSVPDRAGAVAALVVAFTLLRLVLAATLPLLPQEAYYWTWSRQLDWSYFDHPPLAAYSIALTTALLGQTAFGIKCAAVLWSVGWNLLWVRLIIDMFASRRLAFWSLLALNLTLVYQVYGVGPTPDSPLLFAWVGTLWAVWRATALGRPRWWFAAGAFAGGALLSKYSAVLLLPVIVLFLLSSPAQRHWLRRPEPYLAMLLALSIFTPVVVWNAQHDWASFAFQGSRRAAQMGAFRPHFLLNLVGTQLLLLTPYLFVACIAALWRGLRDWRMPATNDRTRLLLLSAALPIALFTLISLRSHVKLNWLATAWWPLIILAAHHALQARRHDWRVLTGLVSSALIVVAAMVVALLPNLPLVADLNSWSGWKDAAAHGQRALDAERAAGREAFVFAPNYKIASLLRFHLPGQPQTYAQDIYGVPALQFDHFARKGDLAGATGILVLSDQAQSQLDLKRLAPYFDAIERIDTVQTGAFGRHTRRIEIYRCSGYAGHPRAPAAGDSGDDSPD